MSPVVTSDEFDAWFTTLGDEAKVEIIAKVELLKQIGHQSSRPHADTLKGSRHANMNELRGKTATEVLRVAFAFDPERNAILLIGGNKSGVSERRFYRSFIERADRIFDAHLARIKTKKKGN